MARRAFLGLGANVGERHANLRQALRRLSQTPGVNLLRQSRVYETEPIGVVDQPRFLNMVVEIEVADTMSPRDLLTLVKRIETQVGRTRRERWGPREIDIDVLLLGDERVKERDFEVPHPRMWERAFVMAPLAELEPEMEAPGGESVSEVAERLRTEQEIHASIQL